MLSRKRSTWLALIACAAFAGPLFADETADKKSPWLHDYKEAVKRAKKEKKLILMEFTGSDWCPPCIALKKQVFDSPEFKSWAKDRGIILLELDFPKRKSQDSAIKRQNATLAQSLGVRSFPTIMLLDGSGKPLGGRISGYGGQDPEAWIARAEVTWANALDS